MTDEPLDIDSRELCPDGACVGVLGDDGRCRVCGLGRDGAMAVAAAGEPTPGFRGEDADREALEGFDPGRRLCPDGACIGVLDDAGKCKTCGILADGHRAS